MQEKENKDDLLKDLLSASKMEAGENLKYRIMQQIQTEHSLKKKNVQEKKINMQINSLLKIGGCAYLLIAIVAIFVFVYKGKEALFSPEFFIPSIFIVFIGVLWYIISYLDANVTYKSK